jgi:hypothetical protein
VGLVVVIATVSGSKASIPSAEQVKEDLLGENLGGSRIGSIEYLEIEDTVETNQFGGYLEITAVIEYTSEAGDYSTVASYKERVSAYYLKSASDGWAFDIVTSHGLVE